MTDELKLTKQFYSIDHIKKGINAYKRIAKIKVKEDMDYYICQIKTGRMDSTLVAHEFENYVISLMNL